MKDGTTEEYFQKKGVPRGTPFKGILFYTGMFHVKQCQGMANQESIKPGIDPPFYALIALPAVFCPYIRINGALRER